jgi:hypothetical protein
MPRLLLFSSTILSSTLFTTLAVAGPAEKVSEDLDPFLTRLPGLRESPAEMEHATLPDAKQCHAVAAAARKAGLGDDAKIYSGMLGTSWDEAHFDAERRAYLEVRQLGPLCDEYAQLLKMIPAAAAQKTASEKLRIWSSSVKPGQAGSGAATALLADAKRCFEATDAAIKAGAPADRKTKIDDQEITLAEGRAQICEAFEKFGGGFKKDNAAALAAERKKRAEKFVKAVMTGKRLDFFTDNFDVTFYGAGCRAISDPKVLAKATKLYNITIKPDGSALLWTTTFAGNKVSWTSRTYRDEAAANAGCK